MVACSLYNGCSSGLQAWQLPLQSGPVACCLPTCCQPSSCCSCGAKYIQLSLSEGPVACYSPGVLQVNATKALFGLQEPSIGVCC